MSTSKMVNGWEYCSSTMSLIHVARNISVPYALYKRERDANLSMWESSAKALYKNIHRKTTNGWIAEAMYRAGAIGNMQYEIRNKSEGTEDMSRPNKNQLYVTKGKEKRYGTYLTQNSEGQLVLEMRGEGGKCEAFDESKVEKVLPYTVKVARVDDLDATGHYQTKKGAVKKGDIILVEGDYADSMYICRVVELDTKRENAIQQLRGEILGSTKPIPTE